MLAWARYSRSNLFFFLILVGQMNHETKLGTKTLKHQMLYKDLTIAATPRHASQSKHPLLYFHLSSS